ncbi:MAG: hypothetical protein CMH61_01025 [Nanoarchaeota archaeon]|nr:hypothetical protein [Nanoarchaeota archaeon]
MTQTISTEQIFDELKRIEEKMITKEDIQSFMETIGILSNSETMKQISESEEDIKHGRVKEVTSVNDLLSEIEHV